MEISYTRGDLLETSTDALIVPVGVASGAADWGGFAAELDSRLDGELGRIAREARFTGKRGTSLLVATLGRIPARRVVLAGIGSSQDRNSEGIRRGWAAAIVAARDAGATNVASAMPSDGSRVQPSTALVAAVEGARLATYRFSTYVGAARRDDPVPNVERLTFVGDGEAPECDAALAKGAAIAKAVALARDLVNEPASVLTPVAMAEHAERLAAEHDLEIEVLGPAELERLGAGAITAVGKGSTNEPRLIHLTYRPKGSGSDDRQVGLVGKCITFDTGGYSIKPYEGMLEMKGDMAGGAAVLATMGALRPLSCESVVHGVICAAENMISGEAFRPGDILTALNGVTIEVLSTDAEGRLVLADGLVYTARLGVDEMIDLATLTGAANIALGDDTTALFANNDDLAERLLTHSAEAGERCWRMPLIDEFEEKIRGDIGDIKNSGGRPGGAITAALFLRHFCEGLPWAHLDIAGSARSDRAKGYNTKGATGVGVRTLLRYLTPDT
ncbi:MAG: leucyl aminopeptidase [Chloroflexota bacterium]|nr:leucyl aminopeptidase [Chloroflexota bacterium]